MSRPFAAAVSRGGEHVTIVKRMFLGSVAAAAIAGVGSTSTLLAATATANVTVSATVSTSCSITGGSLAFGEYDPVVVNASDPKNGSGTFSVACRSEEHTSELQSRLHLVCRL